MRLLLLLVLLVGCGGGPSAPTVAAATSLRNVMPALVTGFGQDLTVTYGASGTLRQQVEGGAPIDAVVFASSMPVDHLIASGHAVAATRRRLATNDLVLIVPEGGDASLRWSGLPGLPVKEKLAIGEPGAVPAGRYAREALQGLGSWDALQDRIVFGGDVAAVLAYARRGEVAAAAVYATDAAGIPDVTVVEVAAWPGAPRPEVVGAAITDDARARAFLDFVASPAGQKILASFGFGPA